MLNNIWWLVLLLINFLGITLSYKFFKKTGLFIWIAMAAIIANIQVIKTIEVFGYITTLGNIIYGTSYLATDILNEKYGRKEAQKGVYIGIFILITVTVIMQICLQFAPLAGDEAALATSNALDHIFGFLPRIAFASIVAYAISQLHDVWAFDKWKKKLPKHLWIRNNLSTLTSQLLDNLVFTFLAFWGVLPFSVMVEIFIITYIMKFIVAALDTPFIYLARRMHPDEGIDAKNNSLTA